MHGSMYAQALYPCKWRDHFNYFAQDCYKQRSLAKALADSNTTATFKLSGSWSYCSFGSRLDSDTRIRIDPHYINSQINAF